MNIKDGIKATGFFCGLSAKHVGSRLIKGIARYTFAYYFALLIIASVGFLFWVHQYQNWHFDSFQFGTWLIHHWQIVLLVALVAFSIAIVSSIVAYCRIVNPVPERHLPIRSQHNRLGFFSYIVAHARVTSAHWWNGQRDRHVFRINMVTLLMGLGAITFFVTQFVLPTHASHSCSDAVSITANTTWSSNQCHGDVTVTNDATLTINGGITADLTSLTLGDTTPSNGFITAKGDTLNNLGVTINVDGNFEIKSGSSISANGQGYTGGGNGTAGDGPGGGGGNNGGSGGGAGYGGNGGNPSGASGGPAYGSIGSPTALGSGGGGGANGGGATGGGAVKINASSGTVTVNGSITANGNAGGGFCCAWGGGGSGGSIWITANTLAGSGSLTANGGNGGNGGSAGGGSGGRISVTDTTDSSTITSHAFEGQPGDTTRGAAGTVSVSGSLSIVESASYSDIGSALTPLTDASYTYATTTIKDGANVTIANSTTFAGGTTTIQNYAKVTLLGNSTVWSGGALTIQTGTNTLDIPPGITTEPTFTGITIGTGTLNHDANTASDLYHIILKSSGSVTVSGTIDVTGKGFTGGATGAVGDGTGAGGGSVGSSGGGAGHGGAGGAAGGSGGITYGSATQPVALGSGGGGGGSSPGGAGGGAVKIVTTGTLSVTGTITTNGATGGTSCCGYGGGGSGGSVLIGGSTLSGNGTISANGGNGGSGSAGCGGGGRVARDYTTDSFSGTITVTKGTGSCAAGANGTTQSVGPVTNYLITGLTTPRTAGSAGTITVTARDASNNTNVAYGKTITFTSGDSQAVLPSNYPFTVTDAGVHTFTNGVTLKTAGTESVTGTQSDDGSVTGSQSGITVNAAAVSTLTVTGITDPVTAGAASNTVVTAKDAYSNTATSYTGTITFASNDGAATLPSNYTFVGGDAGTKTFTNGVAMKTAGERTVTATDTVTGSITGTQTAITVNPAAASTFTVTGISTPRKAGVAGDVTVTAKDTYHNTANSYLGMVIFTSSDGQATLPSNYTFVGGDDGTHTFTNGVTLKTVGSKSVTATDTVTSSITGTQTAITVNPAAAAGFILSGVTNPIAAGTATGLTVAVIDAYDNAATDYIGTIHFTSTDATATLPANYAFVAGEAGAHTFTNSLTFQTAGTHSVTGTDTVSSSITGTVTGITVTAVSTGSSGSPLGDTGGSTDSSGGSSGSSSGSGGSGSTTPPALSPSIEPAFNVSIVIIDPANGQFTGTFSQIVNGLRLTLTMIGTIIGNTLSGTVTGTYGERPVTGTIIGTIVNNKIESGTVTLQTAADPSFNLVVLVGGHVTRVGSGNVTPPGLCKNLSLFERLKNFITGKGFDDKDCTVANTPPPPCFIFCNVRLLVSIDPPSGSYSNSILSRLSYTSNPPNHPAVIHFTIDGKDPTQFSPRYRQPIYIKSNTTIKAVAIGSESGVATAVYTFKSLTGSTNSGSNSSASSTGVQANPSGGRFDQPVTVLLTPSDPQSTIFYTTDDSQASLSNGFAYTGPLTLSQSTLLSFVAVSKDGAEGPVSQEQYSFTSAPAPTLLSWPAYSVSNPGKMVSYHVSCGNQSLGTTSTESYLDTEARPNGCAYAVYAVEKDGTKHALSPIVVTGSPAEAAPVSIPDIPIIPRQLQNVSLLASLAAVLLALSRVRSVFDWLRYLYQLILLIPPFFFRRRRPYTITGAVRLAGQAEPILWAILILFDAHSLKRVDATLSNKAGLFGFGASPGQYRMTVYKPDLLLSKDIRVGTYHGEALTVVRDHIIRLIVVCFPSMPHTIRTRLQARLLLVWSYTLRFLLLVSGLIISLVLFLHALTFVHGAILAMYIVAFSLTLLTFVPQFNYPSLEADARKNSGATS